MAASTLILLFLPRIYPELNLGRLSLILYHLLFAEATDVLLSNNYHEILLPKFDSLYPF